MSRRSRVLRFVGAACLVASTQGQLCSDFTCEDGRSRIADAAATTGNTTEACCVGCPSGSSCCTGNIGGDGDVTCTAVGASLVPGAAVVEGSTEDECCVVTGACTGNSNAGAEPDVSCFHIGTSLYDPPRLGRNEAACCEAGGAALAFSLFLVLIAMYIIAFACDSFEPAADYLGTEVYKMGPGIRGASIEAVASSLPELFTTLFLLFAHNDQDGFSAGIATCAGSALFNGAIIPAICIFAVTINGVNGEKVEIIELNRAVLVRDGAFFLCSEVLLIFFLNNNQLTWWMGLILMLVYVCYAVILVKGIGGADDDEDADGGDADAEEDSDEKGGDLELADRVQGGEDDGDSTMTSSKDVVQNPMKAVDVDGDGADAAADDDDDDDGPANAFQACIQFDTNYLLFKGADYTPGSAWTNLLACTIIIAMACYVLAESVILSARALGVAPYFTAVILGAAASSVPDTIISYKDALKGDYDDAVANAIGSNIFDICFALGFPLFLYGLINGPVTLQAAGATAQDGNSAEIQSLRVMLVICSVIMLGIFLITKTGTDDKGRPVHYVNQIQASLLTLLYVVWTTIIILQASDVIQW